MALDVPFPWEREAYSAVFAAVDTRLAGEKQLK